MPSHRSPSFSRLKDVLTQIPPRTLENGTTEAASTASPDLAPAEPFGPPSALARFQPALGHTADVQQPARAAPAAASALVARPGKGKVITRPSTFRLAIELQDALKAVAEHNGLNMTDIVAESIWLHIQNFEWPPDSEQLRQRLSRIF
jgi:hypothetical protein